MTHFGVIYRRHGEPAEETFQIFCAGQLPRMSSRLNNGRTWYTNQDGKRDIVRIVMIQRALLARLPHELVRLINEQIYFRSQGIIFTTDPLNEHNGPFYPIDITSLTINKKTN
jgi:hypothetical protein